MKRLKLKLWGHYLLLMAVEEAFKNLKGDLAIRPVFHQLEARIEAHVFIAGRGVAARARGGRASWSGRSHTHSVRSGSRCPSWSSDDGPIGTGTAGANDAGRAFDGVRGRNDTSQQE